ncbi:MAG: zf-HC2 domain-containing protein [Deltaproteobacteria bacterium]|nr:zf-HC2 domain-containing protein [Deltaproteobacteria bacterium]MCL5276540.1 zf-HC2 domain-containing protein [Deltaproteobacteria bacterium]
MRCSKARKLLSPYIDDELTAVQKGLIESHIKDCVRCGSRLEALRGIQSSFARLERPAAPYGFATRVMSGRAERQGSLPFLPPVFTRLMEAAVIAATILIGTKAGSFLGGAFTRQKTTIVSSLYLDNFESIQPRSIGGAYIAMVEGSDEK